MPDLSEFSEIRKLHEANLFSLPNVNGVAVGYKNGDPKQGLAVVALVTEKGPVLSHQAVPQKLGGAQTDVIQVGHLRALGYEGRFRPIRPGSSVGHRDITAGTLGLVVDGMILSNNHVLANSNAAEIGDPIYQPGPVDGGTAQDEVAKLVDFVAIKYLGAPSTCPVAGSAVKAMNALAALVGSEIRLQQSRVQSGDNLVDAAIASINEGVEYDPDVLEIGEPKGTIEATLGMPIQKTGRTTGHTVGEVLAMDATVKVSYGEGRTAQFSDQLVAGNMSAGGDSGSAVFADDGSDHLVIGLLFAGSPESTIINRIQNVEAALGVKI